MKKIFISGSRALNDYNLIKSILDCILPKSDDILVLVGDCYGVDTQVQKYCNCYDIPFVVYHIGEKPRNLVVSNTPVKKCSGNKQTNKDIQMSMDCDCGIAFWDCKSSGTKANIQRLKDLGKECKVLYL